MEKIKKKLITFLIILFIIIAIIYNLFIKKDETEIFSYYEDFENKAVSNSTEPEKEEIKKIKIYITGQVISNGTIELDYGSRIEDAIILAGGLTDLADLSKVNLAYPLEDGQKIYIPSIYDTDTSEYISSENGENIIEETTVSAPSGTTKKININTATIENLCTIPGIGESTAEKIISYRKENGKFSSIEDLKNISGIGEKKFEKMKEFVDIK